MAAPMESITLRTCRYISQSKYVCNNISSRLNVLRPLNRFFSCNNVGFYRVRFAPSPTGHLHLGGLRTALYNFLFARSSEHGTFILRIEDTDQSRAVPGAVEQLQETLRWAGIDPDEGPSQGGRHGPYIQSQRLNLYQEHIKTLLNNGWAYPCFCTTRRLELMRKEAARQGEHSKYDGRCRSLSAGQVETLKSQGTPYAVRLKLEPTPEPWDDLIKGEMSHDVNDSEGDPILMKSDGFPTYHFANVVDDHLMEVSHVLRGTEWLASTPKHLLIYKAFGWSPPKFGHLPLIVNQDGTKLSKRQNDIHVEHFIEEGFFPQAVLNYITSIGGGFSQSTLDMSLEEMCASFDVTKMRSNPSQLNPHFLSDANRHVLTSKAYSQDPAVVATLVSQVRQLVVKKFNDRLEHGAVRDQVLSEDNILKIIRWSLQDDRTSKLSDFVTRDLEYLWVTPSQSHLSQLLATEVKAESLLSAFLEWVSAQDNFTIDHLGRKLRQFAQSQQTKTGQLFTFLRMVFTGLKEGPPVAEMLSVFGKESVILRVKSSLEAVRKSEILSSSHQ